MEIRTASATLSALAHEGRLGIFRELVRAGLDGLAAGELARAVGMAPSTLSANLTLLSHAGLVHSTRCGRSIIYRAALDRMTDLIGYLLEDCCQGRPEACGPLADIVASLRCGQQPS